MSEHTFTLTKSGTIWTVVFTLPRTYSANKEVIRTLVMTHSADLGVTLLREFARAAYEVELSTGAPLPSNEVQTCRFSGNTVELTFTGGEARLNKLKATYWLIFGPMPTQA